MSENRFDKARDRLAQALKNLEEIVIEKIKETSIDTQMLNAVNTNGTSLVEQSIIINNLSEELNKIQKTMREIDKENEFLKDKNQFFADKIFKFKSQGSNLIQAVESDLVRVKEIIKNANSG